MYFNVEILEIIDFFIDNTKKMLYIKSDYYSIIINLQLYLNKFR